MLSVLFTSLVALVTCVFIHHRLLGLLSVQLPHLRVGQRRVMLGIIGALGAHLLEIAVFAAAMSMLHRLPADWGVGQLQSTEAHGMTDFLYWSAVSYTTMGFEHATPLGAIRLLVGMEALVGLVLVAWTASFTYVQMDKYWSEHPRK